MRLAFQLYVEKVAREAQERARRRGGVRAEVTRDVVSRAAGAVLADLQIFP